MATTGDPTDPRGTKRPTEDPILESSHTYRPIKVAKRQSKICLPAHIRLDDAYSIFCLFFNDEALDIIIKNTNVYGSRYCQSLKATWHDISVIELKAFLGILIYRSLHSSPKHKDYWNSADDLKPMHPGLTNTLSRDRFLQIEACLHLSDPDVKGDVFSKLEPVNTML